MNKVASNLAAPGMGEPSIGHALRQELLELVAATLEMPESELDAQVDLTTLGIDSLKAIEVQQAIQARYGVELPLEELFEGITIDAIARAILVHDLGSPDQTMPAPSSTPRAPSDGPGPAAAAPATWPERGWLYRGWGRGLHLLNGPLDLLYRALATRTTVLGAEHLAHLPQQVIFASTHRSYLDPQVLRLALRRSPARAHSKGLIVVGGTRGFTGAVGRGAYLLAASTGVYLIDNDRRDEVIPSLQGLIRTAGGKSSLLMYPQGHHVEPELEIQGHPDAAFHPGIGWLAREMRVPVVPCGLAGTEHLLPGNVPPAFKGLVFADIAIRFDRGPVVINFGLPLAVDEGESARDFTRRLQQTCYALSRAADAAREAAQERGSRPTR